MKGVSETPGWTSAISSVLMTISRDAGIDWDYTSQRIGEDVQNAFLQTDIIITQGFIGSTDEMKHHPGRKEATIPLPYLPTYCRGVGNDLERC